MICQFDVSSFLTLNFSINFYYYFNDILWSIIMNSILQRVRHSLSHSTLLSRAANPVTPVLDSLNLASLGDVILSMVFAAVLPLAIQASKLLGISWSQAHWPSQENLNDFPFYEQNIKQVPNVDHNAVRLLHWVLCNKHYLTIFFLETHNNNDTICSMMNFNLWSSLMEKL